MVGSYTTTPVYQEQGADIYYYSGKSKGIKTDPKRVNYRIFSVLLRELRQFSPSSSAHSELVSSDAGCELSQIERHRLI